MAINLTKGQRIDLTKKGDSLDRVHVGLGWDAVGAGGGGLLSKIFGAGGADIDCDASVLMLDENDKLASIKHLIYFGNLKSKCKSVQHLGDNLTGDGDGDDEVINVSLKKVPGHIHKLVFVVNIYDCLKRKQHFGMIKNAFIRILDKKTGKELIIYKLSDDYKNKTALIAGEIYRHGGEWKFNAIGQGTNDTEIQSIVNKYK
ncbi:TerD family protein [Puteibacter caeruleilacunae]|nr:TerD family protein [Puteibacter caeruleilacunae]